MPGNRAGVMALVALLLCAIATAGWPDEVLRAPLGTNLAPFGPGSGTWPFKDAMRHAPPFHSATRSAGRDARVLDTDAAGWVRSLAPGQIAVRRVFGPSSAREAAERVGDFTVLYRGRGELRYAGDVELVSRAPGRDVIRVGRGRLEVVIAATDPRDHLRDIQVLLPGGTCGDDLFTLHLRPETCEQGFAPFEATEAEQPFHPTFLDDLRPFRVLRFTDWLGTNRRRGYRDTDPVDLGLMIRLANLLHAHPYINVHHRASDARVRQMARVVAESLAPGLVAYVEYTNEPWNPALPQHAWLDRPGCWDYLRARPRTCAAGEPGAAGECAFGSADAPRASCAEPWRVRYRERAMEVMALFDWEIADPQRLVRVVAARVGELGAGESTLLEGDAAAHFDAYALTAFFGARDGGPPVTDAEDAFRRVTVAGDAETWLPDGAPPIPPDAYALLAEPGAPEGNLAGRIGRDLAALRGRHEWSHLDLLAYAGGQQLSAEGGWRADAVKAANRDPRMKALYLDFLRAWSEVTDGALFIHYQGPGRWRKGTAFGSKEFQGQALAEAPKHDALSAFAESFEAHVGAGGEPPLGGAVASAFEDEGGQADAAGPSARAAEDPLAPPDLNAALETFSVELAGGWNLVSIPLAPADTAPGAVLASIAPELERAFAYRACDTGDPWKLYDPADAAGSDLAAMDHRVAVWLLLRAPATLTVEGELPLAPVQELCPGLNLLAYPHPVALPVRAALRGIDGAYTRAYGYRPAAAEPWDLHDRDVPPWVNDLELLEPGKGYWVLATEARSVEISGPLAPPVIESLSLAEGQEIVAPVEITATVSSPVPAEWRLEQRAKGSTGWTLLAAGDTGTSPDVRAVLDPTLLRNDIYEVRLTSTDLFGQVQTRTANVLVTGEQKVGLFSLSFVDLSIPVPGTVDIEIHRRYDSRDKRAGEMGVGWELVLRRGTFRHNRPPGEEWIVTSNAGEPPCARAEQTAPHFTEVRFSDRDVYRFRFEVQMFGFDSVVGGGCVGEAAFVQTGGPPGATLDVLGSRDVFWRFPSRQVVDFGSGALYDPNAVRLTTAEGLVFDLVAGDGARRIIDLNGNTLDITREGIIHSAGRSVRFIRDDDGRIVRVTDPNGNGIGYVYDERGDLVTVLDAEGRATRHGYDARHNLLSVEDPLGRQPVRNEYDDDGRLVATVDANGNRQSFEHDLDARRDVVRDRLGNVEVREYDEVGNITAIVDKLGNRREFSYDERGNRLTETDPLGRVSVRSYDASDNVVSMTDFDGNTTTHTYNHRNQLLVTTDPDGNRHSREYDDRGNLVRVVDALGNVSVHSYDDDGRMLARTDALGGVTTLAYDAAGDWVGETDALGNSASYVVDENGNRLAETRTRTSAGGAPESLTERFEYDTADRVIGHADALGNAFRVALDAVGDTERVSDRRGAATDVTRDANGNATAVTFRDGATATSRFDAEDRETARVDADGNETRYEYDEQGRVTRLVHPDGASRTLRYDAVARVLGRLDERGNETTYRYPANQQVVTDPIGNETRHAFDAAGRRTRMDDALGRTTAIAYDGNGQRVTTTFDDGSTITEAYDALGRKISETDQAGVTTRFEHDALGRLTGVIDALGAVTRYAYDEVGNLVEVRDAEGRVTRLAYDPAGRLASRTLPLGQVERFEYDANGNLTAHTTPEGATVRFAYDAEDRLIERRLPDGTVESFAYTPGGQRIRAGGDSYAYDERGRLVLETKASGATIGYEYDAAGNRTAITTALGTTTYEHDALDRLVAVTDRHGAVTRYGYDEVGNRTGVSYPNGVTSSASYDALNRLTAIQIAGPSGLLARYEYTLGPAGNRLRLRETGPATSGRTVDYGYDALYRLVEERIDEPGTDADRVIGYAYDAVGNRVERRVEVAGRVAVTSYLYDANNRLLEEQTTVTLAALPAPPALAGAGGASAPGYLGAAYASLLLLAFAAPLSGLRRRERGHGNGVANATRRSLGRMLVVVLAGSQVIDPRLVRAAQIGAFPGEAAVTAGAGEPLAAERIVYEYDDNGHLVGRSDGVAADRYVYDAAGRLTGAEIELGPEPGTVEFEYDADGVRTGKTVDGVPTVYLVDKNREFAEVIETRLGVETVEYVVGDHRIGERRAGGAARYHLHDGQHSTRLLTDDGGAVTDRYTFDAFGILLDASGLTDTEFLYAGEQLDANVGFYYLRARYYAQAAGRFVSPDPAEPSVFDPRTLHKYLYANASPIDNRDPSGLFSLASINTSIAIISLASLTAGGVAGAVAYDYTRSLAIAVGVGLAVALLTYLVLTGGLAVARGLGVLAPGGVTAASAQQAASRRDLLDTALGETARAAHAAKDGLASLQRYVDVVAQTLSRPGKRELTDLVIKGLRQTKVTSNDPTLAANMERLIAELEALLARTPPP